MTQTTAPEQSADTDPRVGLSWTRVAVTGAVTVVVWSIVLQLIAGTLIPPVAVIGAVFLVATPFLAPERRKTGLGLAVFSVLAVAGNLPGILDELSHPASAPAFILTLASVLGAGLAAVGGLGMFFGWASDAGRRLVSAAAAIFVVGSFTSVSIAATTESDSALPTDVEVVAETVEWHPGTITMTTGASGIWVDNRDGIRHTFTVPELDIDLEIPALKTRRIDVEAAPGTYQIVCDVPGHEDMTATLTVEG